MSILIFPSQFELENEQLFEHVNTMVDEVRQIEGKVIEISKLQEIFSEKVLQQVLYIHVHRHVHAHAHACNEGVYTCTCTYDVGWREGCTMQGNKCSRIFLQSVEKYFCELL